MAKKKDDAQLAAEVAGIPIRRDREGRYYLNDLKRAAAAFEGTHTREVSTFRRAKETLALIDSLAIGDTPRSAVIETLPSRRGGTIACEQVALAFAHWVGREFCAAVTHALQVAQSPSIGREHINQNKKESKEMDHSTNLYDQMKQPNESTSANQPLFIAGIAIQQDESGRYRLNDLHKAAGGENKHKTNLWLSNDQTKALVSELEAEAKNLDAGIPASKQNQPVSVVKGLGQIQQGTYVRKELVYLYAMWISPKFNLAVIRAFDVMVTGHQPLIETELTYDIEKACDFRSWKLANEYHQHTMQLIGNAARLNDEQVMSESSFLVKRRLYERLVGFAQIQLEKKSPASFITDLVLSWQP